MNFRTLSISPETYFELLVKPHFADLIPDGSYNGTLREFTVMDDVSSKRKIIDILGTQNILKRRDASCNIVFSPVGKGSTREIKTDPIYAATLQCDNEFYQDCLEDFRNSNPRFTDYILEFFQKAIRADLNSNAYFGDINRPNDATGVWNWNSFDGVFKHLAEHISDGLIPRSQTSVLNEGSITPEEAYDYLNWAWSNQDIFLKHLPDAKKAFYVSQSILDAYEEYLTLMGGSYNIQYYINGVPNLKFKRIDVLAEPTWDPIMSVLNAGNQAHACILTIRGNFVFATDKTYGERTDEGIKSLIVWYDKNTFSWKYSNFLRAGTGIAFPEHSVIGLTNF